MLTELFDASHGAERGCAATPNDHACTSNQYDKSDGRDDPGTGRTASSAWLQWLRISLTSATLLATTTRKDIYSPYRQPERKGEHQVMIHLHTPLFLFAHTVLALLASETRVWVQRSSDDHGARLQASTHILQPLFDVPPLHMDTFENALVVLVPYFDPSKHCHGRVLFKPRKRHAREREVQTIREREGKNSSKQAFFFEVAHRIDAHLRTKTT